MASHALPSRLRIQHYSRWNQKYASVQCCDLCDAVMWDFSLTKAKRQRHPPHPGVTTASSWSLPVWGWGKGHNTEWRLRRAAGWSLHSDKTQTEQKDIRWWEELVGWAVLSQQPGLNVMQEHKHLLLSYTNMTNTITRTVREVKRLQPLIKFSIEACSTKQYVHEYLTLLKCNQMHLTSYTHSSSETNALGNTDQHYNRPQLTGVWQRGKRQKTESFLPSHQTFHLCFCVYVAKTTAERSGSAIRLQQRCATLLAPHVQSGWWLSVKHDANNQL